jgi:hypothetical protein
MLSCYILYIQYVPTVGCMNLAASVNVLLYDRLAKDAGRAQGDALIARSRQQSNHRRVPGPAPPLAGAGTGTGTGAEVRSGGESLTPLLVQTKGDKLPTQRSVSLYITLALHSVIFVHLFILHS